MNILKKKRARKSTNRKIESVTKFLFVATQIAAIVWISLSYLIAIYATVRLGQPFPVVELSQQAITSIIGVNTLKVVENIFEHNNGFIFGKCKDSVDEEATI